MKAEATGMGILNRDDRVGVLPGGFGLKSRRMVVIQNIR